MIDVGEIQKKAQRLWPTVLRSILDNETVFPWVISLGTPRGQDLLTGFGGILNWLADIRSFALQHGFSFRETKIKHRQLGEQVVPTHLVLENRELYLRWQGKLKIFQTCEAEAKATLADFPELRDWLLHQMLQVEKHREDWPAVRATLRRFADGDVSRHFLRELDIRGVDSKFVERHRILLAELLSLILPPHRFDSSMHPASINKFCQKFGLRYDQSLIRFRWVDESLKSETSGFSDLSIPVKDFCRMQTKAQTIFIAENKINALSFPPYPGGMVIFGLGKAVDLLRDAPWLHTKQLVYWGDLDSHGFAILARWRKHFPQTRSLLMDERTLLNGRDFWIQEGSPCVEQIDLSCLSEEEQSVFAGLQDNRYAINLRLEQERIPFAMLEEKLDELRLNGQP